MYTNTLHKNVFGGILDCKSLDTHQGDPLEPIRFVWISSAPNLIGQSGFHSENCI